MICKTFEIDRYGIFLILSLSMFVGVAFERHCIRREIVSLVIAPDFCRSLHPAESVSKLTITIE